MKPSKSWVKFVSKIKREFPLDKPVDIEFIIGLKELGIAIDDGRKYLIQLRYSRLWIMKDTLMHEYAHLRCGWSDRVVHTNRWGVEYARIYREMVEKVKS